MKKIYIAILAITISSCCSHRKVTTETRTLALDSAVTLYATNDSIFASRFDSIISTLEVTIDYIIVNDSTKEKKVKIHANKEQVTKQNVERKNDSSQFQLEKRAEISENKKASEKKMNNHTMEYSVLIIVIVLFISGIYFHFRR